VPLDTTTTTVPWDDESGRGLPHSKTLSRAPRVRERRKVLECGSPLPLWVLRLAWRQYQEAPALRDWTISR